MQKLKGINLVIASGSETVQNCLQEAFAKQGAEVVLCGFLDLNFVDQLEHNVAADVILIDMDDSYEEDDDALDRLLEKNDLPILFHDNDFDELNDSGKGECFSISAVEKLAAKLAELVDSSEIKDETNDKEIIGDIQTEDESNTDKTLETDRQTKRNLTELELHAAGLSVADTVFSEAEDPSAREAGLVDKALLSNAEPPANKDSSDEASLTEDYASNTLVNIWVLGASIGGPEAVKRFLARIPGELPVAFVLAQHLGDGFVSLLANQLDRITSFKVKEGTHGDSLRHGEVVVVPVNNRMSLDDKGHIKFVEGDWKGHYKPSIDCVIDDVTSSFKKQAGVIIFSGMGADGVLACQQFAEKYNGNIWAQSTGTCVISSMPDSVRKANLVSYSGSPEALALKIAVHYMGKESYIV